MFSLASLGTGSLGNALGNGSTSASVVDGERRGLFQTGLQKTPIDNSGPVSKTSMNSVSGVQTGLQNPMNSDSGSETSMNSGSGSGSVVSRFVGVFLRIQMLRRLCWSLAGAGVVLAGIASVAVAAAPALKVTTITPDHVMPGTGLPMFISVQNMRGDALDGPLTIRTRFPVGIVPADWSSVESSNVPAPQCQIVGQVDECVVDVTGIQPGVQVRLRLNTTASINASGPLAGGQIDVSGGGTVDSFTEPLSIVAGPIDAFAIQSFDVDMADGPRDVLPTQAGSDPMELTTQVGSLSESRPLFESPIPNLLVIAPKENFRDVIVHVPPGLIGNPTSTGVRCTSAQLISAISGTVIPQCPPESQIGVAQLNTGDVVPVYNIQPPTGSPAEFGFFYNSVVVTLLAKVRPSDNGIDIITQKAVSSVPIPKFEVTLWGVPSDPSHDPVRGICLQGGYGFNAVFGPCALRTRSNVPFLRTPTSCPGTPLAWSIDMDTYQNVGNFVHNQTTTPPVQGCEYNPFDPRFSLVGSTKAPHTASGVDATVSLPQDVGAGGIAEADLRRALVTLPEGLTINPSSADGLAACTDAELGLRQEGPATCPDASKIGNVTLKTQLLDHPIGGSIFLRTQNSDNPLSGELFRIAVELRSDDDGIAIKLPGALSINPNNGQVTTIFDELPQLPFEQFNLHFKQGARAPLVTPRSCGTYATHAIMESWGGKLRELTSRFDISANPNGPSCGTSQFAPSLMAGTNSPSAGAFTPFTLRLQRSDEDQEFESLRSLSLPPGLSASLRGTTYCSDSALDAADTSKNSGHTGAQELAAPSCPASSRIGTATVGAGAGPSPFYVDTGKVYLAGPYRGAPLSIAVSVPAVAGPFDLGNVITRAALYIDPSDASLRAVSDPFPTILDGIPLQIKDIRLNVDRPHFMINPTNCSQMSVNGTVLSTENMSADVHSRFQVGECAALGFKPKLSFRLKGGTKRGDHPKFQATLKARPGDANIDRVSVALPHSEFLDQAHIGTVCTRPQFAAGKCPPASVYGYARAITPLLDKPLEGPVYLRSSDNKLPDLVADLNGQIHIVLDGRIDSVNGGIRNTFDVIPDAPVSKFTLHMQGGKKGLLVNSTSLCKKDSFAVVKVKGQNGAYANQNPQMQNDCGSKHGKKKH